MEDAPIEHVGDWLERRGLGKYASLFADHEINLEVLPCLTESDVDRLGLPTGPRRRLLLEIEALRAAAAPARSFTRLSASRAHALGIARQAERRQLTVMFCDLVGSTALAGRMDLEELRELMDAYRCVCSEVVARYKGYVAQYLGDGLMVYFGWPSAHEDDAERAIRTALDMVVAVRGVRKDPPIDVRIGVATGTVVVGAVSPDAASHSTLALGETPNMAARLQTLARPGEIVISSSTRQLVGETFELHDLGTHLLHGIAQPVKTWRVRALHRIHGRFLSTRGIVLTPLVGRSGEIAALHARWQQARRGEGQVVFVGGDPGIGKSRLVHALRDCIGSGSCTALSYQCSPYHVNHALYPIIEHIELAARFEHDDTPALKLDKLEQLLVGDSAQRAQAAALFAALLSLQTDCYPALDLPPQKQKQLTLEAMVGQVEARSRRGPLLMVFEDVHWIDPTTEEAIEVLIARLPTLPILLVVTHRPEYLPDHTNQPHVNFLPLNRLEQHEAAELVGKVAQGRALPAQVLEQIVAHTDGVPLFVEELTKTVLESCLLRKAENEYVLGTPVSGIVIPSSLRDSLLARLDRFAPVKQLLQIGSCIGREFSHEVLAKVAALPDAQLEESLAKLMDAGLIHRQGPPARRVYVFKHALLQDAAYDSLLKRERQELHAQIAQILQRDFADQAANEPELLTHPYTAPGTLQQPRRYGAKRAS